MKETPTKVLIVDPDPLFAERVRALLACEACALESVPGVAQAVERLVETPFACAIVDEDLPEMKGYAAVPVLHAVAPSLQIIMTAARNTTELESKVREQDVFYYYVKSFDMQELRMAVSDAFRKTRRCEGLAAQAAGRREMPEIGKGGRNVR